MLGNPVKDFLNIIIIIFALTLIEKFICQVAANIS